MLCVLTNRCGERWFRRASAGPSWWRNALGSERRLWQPAEPIDDGRRAKCSRTHWRRFRLERHASLMKEKCSVARESVKVLTEALGGALLRDKMASLDCHITKNRPEMGLERADRIIHHVRWQHLLTVLISL